MDAKLVALWPKKICKLSQRVNSEEGITDGRREILSSKDYKISRRPHIEFDGGQGRNRTADAGLFRAALYQLSYLAWISFSSGKSAV
jgi:hypothetical protein